MPKESTTSRERAKGIESTVKVERAELLDSDVTQARITYYKGGKMADTPETNEAPAAEVDDAKPAKRALIEAAVARIERKLSGFYALRSRRVRPKAKEPSQRDLHRAEARKRDLAERQEARKRLVERLTKELAERDAALDRKRAARARQRRAERD